MRNERICQSTRAARVVYSQLAEEHFLHRLAVGNDQQLYFAEQVFTLASFILAGENDGLSLYASYLKPSISAHQCGLSSTIGAYCLSLVQLHHVYVLSDTFTADSVKSQRCPSAPLILSIRQHNRCNARREVGFGGRVQVLYEVPSVLLWGQRRGLGLWNGKLESSVNTQP